MKTEERVPADAAAGQDFLQLTLQHADGTLLFRARRGQTLLDAALDSGVLWPYGCRSGECGVCKCELIAGHVLPGWADPLVLSDREKKRGKLLACTALVHGDAELRVNRLDCVAPFGGSLRVVRLERRTPDVVVVHLAPAHCDRLTFQAGQYLQLTLPNGAVRAYSMANEPGTSELEFHIRRQPNGLASMHAYDALCEGDLVGFGGPHGQAVLQAEDCRPMLAVCCGTGYAPLRSIIRQALACKPDRVIHLCWFVRGWDDAYDVLSLYELQENNPGFTFSIYAELNGDEQAQTVRNLLAWHVGSLHAAGASRFVGATRAAFLASGLPETDFYADSFGDPVELG